MVEKIRKGKWGYAFLATLKNVYMKKTGFKKSLFGFNNKEVISYMDELSKDIEKKLRMKDDDIKGLRKENFEKDETIANLEGKVEELEEKIETMNSEHEETVKSLTEKYEEEIRSLKLEHNSEIARLNDELKVLRSDFVAEKDKISSAILMAEAKAEEIIASAKIKGDKIYAEAMEKAENEKLRYKKTKADVDDFTYDVKKLLDKLTGDIKDKLGKD